jgi:hypothetical protein
LRFGLLINFGDLTPYLTSGREEAASKMWRGLPSFLPVERVLTSAGIFKQSMELGTKKE